jgi:hypothetical protein
LQHGSFLPDPRVGENGHDPGSGASSSVHTVMVGSVRLLIQREMTLPDPVDPVARLPARRAILVDEVTRSGGKGRLAAE